MIGKRNRFAMTLVDDLKDRVLRQWDFGPTPRRGLHAFSVVEEVGFWQFGSVGRGGIKFGPRRGGAGTRYTETVITACNWTDGRMESRRQFLTVCLANPSCDQSVAFATASAAAFCSSAVIWLGPSLKVSLSIVPVKRNGSL